MTEQRWEQLVHRLEEVAARDPRGYRLRVGMLAGVGFGYLVVVLVILLALVAGVAAIAAATAGAVIKFAWPLLVLAFVVLRALWFRIPPPDGVAVDRGEAPGLWSLVDDARKRLKAPRIHKLLLDDDLNAGVVQVPRFGVMGPSRNYLIIGLPLLQAVSPEQFHAVLAHELGHLSGNHSRFSGWIYRLRRTYANLLRALEQRQSRGIWLFRRFFEWYSPYFAAYSFALARQNEYVADRAAAEATSPRATAGTLVRIGLTSHWLDSHYWPSLHRHAEDRPEPPRNAFTSLGRQLPLDRDASDPEVLRAMLAEATGTADTHPSLSDRLQGLGVAAEEAEAAGVERPAVTAADELLDGGGAALLARFDEHYHQEIQPAWQQAHEEAREARARYEALRAAGAQTAGERVELGLLTARFEDDAAAQPHFESALAADPEHPVAAYHVGRARLRAGDASGLALLDRAIEHDPDAVIPSCELAYRFLQDRGEHGRAERYRERAEQQLAEFDAAAAERQSIDPGDPLTDHELPEPVVRELCAVLASERRVRRGYLARKRTRHLGDRAPIYLVAVEVPRWGDDEKLVNRLVEAIELPGPFFVVTLGGRLKGFKRTLADMPAARVYSR